MKRMLSPAFSHRSLLKQETIIGGIIDRFVRIIGEKAPPRSSGINMTKWYEMCSFDILGEMAFGESFKSLEADSIAEHWYFVTLFDNLRRVGAIARLFRHLVPTTVLVQNRNSRYSRDQVEKRLARKESREDFLGILVAEIRGAFKSYEDIKAKESQQLHYLQAVINEGLRHFPPVPLGLPRISPGFVLHDKHIPEGAEIYTSTWTVTHDPQHFCEPMEFKPERWLDPDSTDLKDASQPFSLGPRACIGRK
ncbi:MAG: hypothetical protein Q9181_005669 [Wetmoreana brouardii]